MTMNRQDLPGTLLQFLSVGNTGQASLCVCVFVCVCVCGWVGGCVGVWV